MSFIEKIVLGTVQFGIDYGINNISGKVHPTEVCSILDLANRSGIKILDTSYAYGESELVLGKCLNDKLLNFKIISKFPQCTKSVDEIFEETLIRLKTSHLYGYLVHHFNFYLEHPEIWESFKKLKDKGQVEKIGFSIYSSLELEYLLEHNIQFDLIQFPYNIFDRQFDPYLGILKKNNVEVHTRSVFLQGLFFKDVDALSERLLPLKPYLALIHSYCDKNTLSIEQLALNWVLSKPEIDGVLIGVDNIGQLTDDIKMANGNIGQNDIDFIESIQVKEKELLNPVNWK